MGFKQWIKQAYKDVKNELSPVVSRVYGDGKSVVSFFGRQIDRAGATASGLVGKVGDTVKEVGGSIGEIGMYAAIGLAAVGVAYVVTSNGSGTKRQNSRMLEGTSKRGRYDYSFGQ